MAFTNLTETPEESLANIQRKDDVDRLLSINIHDIIHTEFFPQSQAVKVAFYEEVLQHLLHRIRCVRPMLLHDNALTHCANFECRFLARAAHLYSFFEN